MPTILESKKEYKYEDKYAKFLGYVLSKGELGRDFAQSFASEVDSLQENAFQLRNDFSKIAEIIRTHENHEQAFDHLVQAYQYQLDRIEELTHLIVTKAPLVKEETQAQLKLQIDLAEIFVALHKTHFELETEYAALKDRIEQSKKDTKLNDALNAELKTKEPVVKQLRKTMSDFNKKFKEFEKTNTEKAKALSTELDTLIQQYNEQKNKYDTLIQKAAATAQPTSPVENKSKEGKEKKDSKLKDKGSKLRGAVKLIGEGVKKAGSTVLATPAAVSSVAQKAGSAVLVKPGQKLIKSFGSVLSKSEQSIDPNMTISAPNGTQEYDQILLNEKSPIDDNYKKALEEKIKEVQSKDFSGEEKSLARQLLTSALALQSKINHCNKSDKVDEAVKSEKTLFLTALHASLFPQLKGMNLKSLKLRINDLKVEKRLIEKLAAKDDVEKKKLFTVIDECIKAIKKDRKNIKITKSYDEIKSIITSLIVYKDKYKAAKAEFDKYLTAHSDTPQFLTSKPVPATSDAVTVSPRSDTRSSTPDSLSALSVGSGNSSFTDEQTSLDSSSFILDSASGSHVSLTPTTIGSQTPALENLSPRTSEDLTQEEREEDNHTHQSVDELSALEARVLELKLQEEKFRLEEQAFVEQKQQLEAAIMQREQTEITRIASLRDQIRQQASEYATQINDNVTRTTQLVKQIEEQRKREADEIAWQLARLSEEQSQVKLKAQKAHQPEIAAIANAQEEHRKEIAAIAEEKATIAREKLALATEREEIEKEAARRKVLFDAEAEKYAAEKKAAELKVQEINEEQKRHAKEIEQNEDRLAAERKLEEARLAVEEKQKAEEARRSKELEEKHAREEQVRNARMERWGVSQGAGTNNNLSGVEIDETPQARHDNSPRPPVEPVVNPSRGADGSQSKQQFLVGKEQIEFTIAKMQIARTKIQEFMTQLLEEDKRQKSSWWPFYLKGTKLTKHAELQKLCDVINAEDDANAQAFYKAVKKAREDGGTLVQSVKTDRTRTLLDNIIAGYPERNTNHPTKQERAEQKKAIANLCKSTGNRR